MEEHGKQSFGSSQWLPARSRVLLVRTDHLGDLLLSLPMAQVLKQQRPDCRIAVLGSPANREAAEHHPDVDFVLVDIEAKHSGLKQLWPLVRQLRGRFDVAVVVHPTLRLAAALCLSGVPVRVGTAYRAYSFLFNCRVPQRRRGRPVHEAVLNLELLRPLDVAIPEQVPPLRWVARDAELEAVRTLLAKHDLIGRRWVVIHPGSSGSALNWQAEQYGELGKRLAGTGLKVVLTGTARERELVERVRHQIGGGAVDLAGALSLGELAVLLQETNLFVGGSTGPTHLAAMLGTPTLALYAPLVSQRLERWRPLGPHVVTMVPEVHRQCPRCLLTRCPYYPCMEKMLGVDQVWRAAQQFLARARSDSSGSLLPVQPGTNC